MIKAITPSKMSEMFLRAYEDTEDVEEFVDCLIVKGVECDRIVLMAIWYTIDDCKLGAI